MNKIILSGIYFIILITGFISAEEQEWSEYSAILQPSPIQGLGVFATHEIKAGSRVLTHWYKERTSIKAKYKDIARPFHKYCMDIDQFTCFRPERCDKMEIGWYINHSFDPNVVLDSENHYRAARDIQAGEEILLDYNQYLEPDDCKSSYYKKKKISQLINFLHSRFLPGHFYSPGLCVSRQRESDCR